MAAAYATLVSLLNTMNNIQIHPFIATCFSNYPIQSLRKIVDFLLDFVENHADADIEEAGDLLRRIADIAHDAENIIEVQAADRIRAASAESSNTFLDDLQKIIKEMDSIKVEVIKAKEENGLSITRSSMPPSSSPTPTTAANTTTTMVGFDSYVEQLLDQLTGYHPGRQIIPIVGMGGIGKTTLAKYVYESLHTVHHFDVRAWVTVSQTYNARDILSQALSCLGRSTSTTDHYDQLGEELSKTLFGRRYLVILDDVWSVEAWEKIMFYFPDNSNGSRTVVTTRQQELVDYFSSYALTLKFLDDNISWELFCEKTFGQQGCPHPELEQAGKKIVKKCKGLPLAINVIGGLLGKSLTQQYWVEIAEHKSLVLDSGDESEVMSILYLSYKHLPIRLKPCFLYLGLFPEDDTIDVFNLINLWVAEGFIKPNTDQSLEEVAECYIKELLDRNLLLAGKGGFKGYRELESFRVHDLVRDMCVRIAEREELFCVERDIDGRREFKVDEMRAWFYSHPYLIRPLSRCPEILKGQRAKPFKSRLLRVSFSFYDEVDLETTLREVNLRYLSCKSWVHAVGINNLPSSISLLWSLQTLIIDRISSLLPAEIWMMPQLRHIRISSLGLPDPPPKDDTIVLRNLQSLGSVLNLKFSDEICKRIPNIKELGIYYVFDGEGLASSCYHMQNVGCLNKLEVLRIVFNGRENSGDSLQNLNLPSSLKELSLYGCQLEWSKMVVIASLPHLQVLTLGRGAVVGTEWNLSAKEEFLCLKHLYIDFCHDLIKWNAESSNFPVLETLHLDWLFKLEEIPSGIGDIPTLERIYMSGCSESANISAVKILEEQESLGNESLKLEIEFSEGWDEEKEMLMEKIQELGLTCNNLIISI